MVLVEAAQNNKPKKYFRQALMLDFLAKHNLFAEKPIARTENIYFN